jgi:hypothetical protein
MGVVQHRQIRNHLEQSFVPHIDITDYQNRRPEDQANAALTRGLAAFCVAVKADVTPDVAAKSIVDGFDDNGLDAIFYSATDKILYLVQSKWSNDGTGSIDQGSAEKFVRGVRDLLTLKFNVFNEKVKKRQVELEGAVNNTQRIVLATVHSGSDRLGDHPRRVLEEFLAELNDTGDVASLENLTQVAASDVAEWGRQFRQRIFSKNIRSFLGGSTVVNEGLADSIRKAPSHFWYLNNGITALCGSIRKRPIGGASHEAGTFDCDDVAIVNGAQTVGVISELGPAFQNELQQARVPIRLISLEGCPPEFAMEVTRATNTQNRVDSRNFVALDPEQDRIRAELLVDGIEYEYRQGEGEPTGSAKFGLVDATVALACAHKQVELAVQAKREISKLWEDLGRPPYKHMFNSGLTGLRLWHLVQVLRGIDKCLEEERLGSTSAKTRNIISHSNRLAAHIVMQNLDLSKAGSGEFEASALDQRIKDLTKACIGAIEKAVEAKYEDSYPASLFKNVSKCKDITSTVEGQLKLADNSAAAPNAT